MFCYSVTKRYFENLKVDRRIKLLFLTPLNSKSKYINVVTTMLNYNTYIPTPKQLNLS